MSDAEDEPKPKKKKRASRWIVRLFLLLALASIAVIATVLIAWLRVAMDDTEPSRSLGSKDQHGSLENGHVIPPSGAGFTTYSYLGAALGRQYVHGAVRDLLVTVFADQHKKEPRRVWIVAETGWPSGGPFWPHKTHKAGLSIDLLMPLRDKAGTPVRQYTWPWTLFGYGYELDEHGRMGELSLDFSALADLLLQLDRRAAEHGLSVERIIVAPEYVPKVLGTPAGARLPRVFLREPAWWRHDEHVHVDFAVGKLTRAPRSAREIEEDAAAAEGL